MLCCVIELSILLNFNVFNRMLRKIDGRNRYFEIGVVQTKNNGNLMEILGAVNGFLYLLKDPKDPLLHIHLFESESLDEVRIF